MKALLTAIAAVLFSLTLSAQCNDISISVPTTGGTLSGQIIYVRINQSAPIGTYTGNITMSTTGLANILVPLNPVNTVDACPTAIITPASATTFCQSRWFNLYQTTSF